MVFTIEEVASINDYQGAGFFHPLTCGNDSRHRDLLADEDGLHCLDCEYRQVWAPAFITLGFWREQQDAIQVKMRQIEQA